MAQNTDILDLGRIGLTSGEGRHLDLTVQMDDLKLGGQSYAAVDRVPVKLDVAKMPGGYSLRLRAAVELTGPCMRCLEAAGRPAGRDRRPRGRPVGWRRGARLALRRGRRPRPAQLGAGLGRAPAAGPDR